MAWSVALVVDASTSVQQIRLLIQQMPVWAMETPQRREVARSIWDSSISIWAPEPAFTLFDSVGADPVALCQGMVCTVAEHHPNLARLVLPNISSSAKLNRAMSAEGWQRMPTGQFEGVAFRLPLDTLVDVLEIALDMASWRGQDDLYSAFFAAVGAPEWHGRNFDALNDSISTGGVNETEVPYRIQLKNYEQAASPAKQAADQFIKLIEELSNTGCPVGITL